MKTIAPWDYNGNPENERNPDLDHNKKKSAQDLGYFRENIHTPGPYERRNKWGEVVTHQDGQTHPTNTPFIEGDME